jgi:hypothetical protein
MVSTMVMDTGMDTITNMVVTDMAVNLHSPLDYRIINTGK